MINNSQMKVHFQEYTSPGKPKRRLIYNRIKSYMQAYGLSPEIFEIKGKSVVLKNNNSINQNYLNRSMMPVRPSNQKPNQKISIHRPQTASLKQPNNFDLPISNKYANLFNEIKNAENKMQFQYAKRANKSLIKEEVDETSEQSFIRKHDFMLKNISKLEKVKQMKVQELEIIQSKIDEVKNADINSSHFIIKKIVHKSTLREKKDKAASLIQAHVRGRIYQKRYILQKKKQEEKLRKVICIQQWWKLQMKNLLIKKQFQITHHSKQVRLIDGRTFVIVTNYSYILYRIRLQYIEKLGKLKGDYRFYLNLQNCSNILNQNISKESFQFVSLINFIINYLINIIQIQDDHLIFNFQNQNIIIDIPNLMLQVNLKANFIIGNQYQLLMFNQEEVQQESIKKDQLKQIPQEHIQIEIVQIENQQEIIKQDYQNQQDVSVYNNLIEQQVNKQSIILSSKNIQVYQSSETKENVDQQEFYEENKNEVVQRQIVENQNQEDSSKIINRQIDLNNQGIIENQDKEIIEQQIKIQQNDNEYNNQEQKDNQIYSDELKYKQIQQTIKNQDQDINIQQNLTTFQDPQIILIPIQETHSSYYNDQNLNLEIQQINQNSLQSSNNGQLCKSIQIIRNEIPSISFNKQPDQEDIMQTKHDINQEDSTKCQQETFQIVQLNQQVITQYIQENSLVNQEQILEIMYQDKDVENKRIQFEYLDIKVNKPFEIQQIEEDQQEQILKSEYIICQNSNIISQKEPSQQSFKKKDNNVNQLQQPSQIDFHMLKSCESNVFELPNSVKDTVKYLNSGELLITKTDFLAQLGNFENENNALICSGDLKKELEDLPAPVNLKSRSNNFESQSFVKRIPSDYKSPIIDDTLKLNATFKFQFSQEIKNLESGQLISQEIDIKIQQQQQQDSLEYSIDESQDLEPIYITTIRVDNIHIDVFQIMDILRFKDKNDFYQSFDLKISKIQQSNCEYIIQNLYVYIIKDCINCIESNQIVRIQRYLKRYRFVQSCVLTLNNEFTLICLFKSFFKIRLCIYGQIQFREEIIIDKMIIKQRKILEQNFYSICPLLLSSQMGLEQIIQTIINVLDSQSE
ncbi:unnamed protein product [Paramecium pentaurelia]|uniref:IQ calmodulin-binding motif protein n=1 Tax=Paramecium pentaurelia TaxID=43138 RepID=A0A8S1WNQ7_9CILI|nr:unnamed protein product [Paramecium pentaurelia]